MKIAVYTICKNEEKFVSRWLKSCLDADYILVTDTGSTDKTMDVLKYIKSNYSKFNYNSVNIRPWRFDLPRNFSLMSIPDDIDVCICLDMDEVLVPGWRQLIEQNFVVGHTDRLRYNYIWNWVDGKPGLTYYADKIHARHGFRWKHPVHEVLVKDGRLGPENQLFINSTLIEHHADDTKSRSQYYDLLALAVSEDPNDDRNAHYYARELLANGEYELALKEFIRHTKLPTTLWPSEKAASFRYMGDCYWALGEYGKAIQCFDEAINIVPNEREAYVSMAQAFRFFTDWKSVIWFCEKALEITEKPNTYINSEVAWSTWPQQMLDEAKQMVNNESC